MNQYEITIITKEDAKDAAVKKEIESLGGKITNVSSLGQKQLAYPIKKETAGYYTAVSFEMEPDKVLELNRKLGLKNEIIRHLIITAKALTEVEKEPKPKVEAKEMLEEKAITPEKTAEKPAKEEAIVPKPTAIEEAPEKEITEVPLEKPKKAAKKVVEKPKKTPEVESKPVEDAKKAEEEALSAEDRLKALDEKLNELLKE